MLAITVVKHGPDSQISSKLAPTRTSLFMRHSSSQHPHGADLRKGRVSESGRAYLVTTVAEERRPLFADWRLGRLVVAAMRAEQRAGAVDSLAWVVMPDHCHWLCVLREDSLARLMQRVKSRSAGAIYAALGLRGRVWQKRYLDHTVRAEVDLQALAR